MAGHSLFLSSRDRYIRELLEFHQGCQGPFRGSRGKVGYLSRHRCGRKPHLTLRGKSGFTRVVAENLGFLSSYDREIRDPLVLPQENPVSMRVERAKRSYSTLEIPLQSVQGTRSSSRVKAGSSVFASSADMELRVPMEIQQGSQASSRVETCKSTFLLSCLKSVSLPVELT